MALCKKANKNIGEARQRLADADARIKLWETNHDFNVFDTDMKIINKDINYLDGLINGVEQEIQQTKHEMEIGDNGVANQRVLNLLLREKEAYMKRYKTNLIW
jgi:predicted  nucleic acid-binding Zn-ribbon protein